MERVLRISGAAGLSTLATNKEAPPRRRLAALLLHNKPFFTFRGPPPPRFRIQAAATNANTSNKHLSTSIFQAPSEITQQAENSSSSVATPRPQVNAFFQLNKGTVIVIGAVLLCMAVLSVIFKPTDRTGGSVEDLVKRGQLRSDRRSNSRPLKYDDPFNNPMVKVGERNSVVKMYGKAFRLQPVTLTEEKMTSHQNRRVQAYQWKRPTVFLVEGDQIPDGVDPDTVRWIPPNHPFATAKNDFDEVAAEKNVYQTRGVPSRVRAEHEALRRRMMEAAEKEPEMQVPVFDPNAEGDKRKFDRPFPVLSEQQPDIGLGSRPIKPYENPDGEFSGRAQD
eukprot:c23724_g1_i1 orf=169-1176(+)